MCGIAGFYMPNGFMAQDAAPFVARMADAISHRGPDDSGTWLDSDCGIALAHRRLSILDLSPAGHQPMVSESGRYVLIFNGEIYNHLEIRAEFHEQSWRGHSDTETVLAAIDRWGLAKTLPKLVGMFALALWDRQQRVLYLARDRIGEKPLYYGWQGNVFFFASEMKALQRHPAFRSEIDRNALALYFRYGYIPAPHSIYQGIYKLMPGTLLCLPATIATGQMPRVEVYWSLDDACRKGSERPFQGDDAQSLCELENLLSRSISQQMVADVPLGAFLSGGVDSSLVVALMQRQSSRRIKTFTIGFSESRYNEAEYAKAVAAYLATEHTEFYVTPQDACGVIPQLPAMYDEPFADSSAIPTFLVAKLARQHVTVSLSGDAGDELFGGYSRYLSTAGYWSKANTVPAALRRLASYGVQLLPFVADRYPAVPGMLRAADVTAFYRALSSQWPEPHRIVRASQEPLPMLSGGAHPSHTVHEQMMYADTLNYLPDDVLCKVDRAAMSVSLETRVPLLDHRVIEFAWSLPASQKIRNGEGKWILRRMLEKHVPRELTDRPKMGFGVPVDEWIRGPLREWAEDLLSESRISRDGYLNPQPVRRRWQQHLSGRSNWRDPLWVVLMFQAWLDVQVTGSKQVTID